MQPAPSLIERLAVQPIPELFSDSVILLLFLRETVFVSPRRCFHLAVKVLFWVRNLRSMCILDLRVDFENPADGKGGSHDHDQESP